MNSRVTPINNLPDLEELDTPNMIPGMSMAPNMAPNVGQNLYSNYGNYGNTDIIPAEHSEKIQKFLRNSYQSPVESGMYKSDYNQELSEVQNNHNFVENLNNNMFIRNYPPEIHCIDVSRHIDSCPICSKFYNTDKSIYIIIIVFLAIVCVLLLKRVLEL